MRPSLPSASMERASLPERCLALQGTHGEGCQGCNLVPALLVPPGLMFMGGGDGP